MSVDPLSDAKVRTSPSDDAKLVERYEPIGSIIGAIERYALRIQRGIGHPMDISNAEGIIGLVQKLRVPLTRSKTEPVSATELIDLLRGPYRDLYIDEAADRLSSVLRENERLREAYLRHIQIDNGCIGLRGGWLKRMRPATSPPCGEGKWDANKCDCARQARAALDPIKPDEK